MTMYGKTVCSATRLGRGTTYDANGANAFLQIDELVGEGYLQMAAMWSWKEIPAARNLFSNACSSSALMKKMSTGGAVETDLDVYGKLSLALTIC